MTNRHPHVDPVWRDRSNFIIRAVLPDEGDHAELGALVEWSSGICRRPMPATRRMPRRSPTSSRRVTVKGDSITKPGGADDVFEHLEHFLGPVERGWQHNADGEKMQFQIVCAELGRRPSVTRSRIRVVWASCSGPSRTINTAPSRLNTSRPVASSADRAGGDPGVHERVDRIDQLRSRLGEQLGVGRHHLTQRLAHPPLGRGVANEAVHPGAKGMSAGIVCSSSPASAHSWSTSWR